MRSMPSGVARFDLFRRIQSTTRLLGVCMMSMLLASNLQAQNAVLGSEAKVHVPAALNMQLSGQALFKYWGFEVYEAALWVQNGFKATEPDAYAKALTLQYRRKFSLEDIAQRSVDEIQMQQPRLSPQTLDSWKQALLKALAADGSAAIKPGERLTAIALPGQDVKLLKNGQPLSTFNDLALSQAFMAIWLSPKTSAPQLRKQLLGLKDVTKDGTP
jgi:Chalcone isomerase-like